MIYDIEQARENTIKDYEQGSNKNIAMINDEIERLSKVGEYEAFIFLKLSYSASLHIANLYREKGYNVELDNNGLTHGITINWYDRKKGIL